MNIAIIGGSITEGTGASNYKNSYTYKLEKYFKSKNKKTVIKNLGAGGTTSYFGLFRLKRDLGNFKPDIIFIEFGVNDRIHKTADLGTLFEGLLRECIKITHKIIIIEFPTGLSDGVSAIHKKFAYFYNIPVIDVQDEVWKKIGNREFTWNDISLDNLHPNDKGHELYYEIIRDYIENLEFNELKVNYDNNVLSGYEFANPKIEAYDSKNIEYYGNWKEESFKLNNKFDYGAITKSIGDGVILKFKGTNLSMMNVLSNDSGILECQLDNCIFNIDLYVNEEKYFNTTINLLDLSPGEHKLTMIVSKNRNEKSLGNKVVIGGFLITPGEE